MFTERTRALLESDRSQFLATKMWLGMGFPDMYGGTTELAIPNGGIGVNGTSSSSMIEHEVMCEYSVPAMDDFMVQHQLIPPHHHAQSPAKHLSGVENGASHHYSNHHHHHHHQNRNNQQRFTTSSMRGRRCADATKKQNFQNGVGGRNRTAKADGTYVRIFAEKAVCGSVFLTIWHCNLSAELAKTHYFRLFLAIFSTG